MGHANPQLRDAILAHLRRTHPSICRRWFDDIEALELADGTVKLLVREPIQLSYLQRNCQAFFTEAAQSVIGMLVAVRFVGVDETGDLTRQTPERASGVAKTSGPGSSIDDSGSWSPVDGIDISPDFSFDNFVVGPENRLAHAASVAVAAKPGDTYNPFFIHGGVGLGKTHLLQAICQRALEQDPTFRIHFTSCHDFVNQFHDAVQAGQMSSFRHRFRNVDALVIDDIHDLSRGDRTQEEFFHTFNTLIQARKQVVLSCDAAPNEIPDLEERLSSRFTCGLVARIERPSYETRVQIVKSKAAMRQIPLPDDVASFVATRIDTNIRELEGAIITMQGIAAATGESISLDLAKHAVGEPETPIERVRPTIQNIVDSVTGYYCVKLADLLGKRRQRSIVTPRQVCMWIARKHTRYSLQEIGGYFGGRDHTTVMHAVATIEARRRHDLDLQHDLATLEHRILNTLTAS